MTDRDALRPPTPKVPVSWGELIDKITILEIKRARLPGDAARANVERELSLLLEIAAGAAGDGALARQREQLKTLNQEIWDAVERMREKEAAQAFDQEFIALARAVYQGNDARFAVKRGINELLSSELVEEKSHGDAV